MPQRAHAFARGDTFPSWFPNAFQAWLSTYIGNFRLRQASNTVIEVPAGANDDLAAIAIDGNMRYIEATVQRSHPGGAAATYDVFVTAKEDSITNSPDPYTDHTDYAFALAIVAHNATPTIVPGTVDVHRKVGELTWDGSKITALSSTIGAPPAAHAATHGDFQKGIVGSDPVTPPAIGAPYHLDLSDGRTEGVRAAGDLAPTTSGSLGSVIAAGAIWIALDAGPLMRQFLGSPVTVAHDTNVGQGNPRVDSVVAISTTWDAAPTIQVVKGTPSAGAQISNPNGANYRLGAPGGSGGPALPANSILLVDRLFNAGSAAINGSVDKRVRMGLGSGIVPGARVLRAVGGFQTIGHNSLTAVIFDTAVADATDMWNGTTRLTVPREGWYRVSGGARWDDSGSSIVNREYIAIRLNGGALIAIVEPGRPDGTGLTEPLSDWNLATDYPLVVGDYLELVAFQTNSGGGSRRVIEANGGPYLAAVWSGYA